MPYICQIRCSGLAGGSQAWILGTCYVVQLTYSSSQCTHVNVLLNIVYPDIHDDVIKWKHFPRYWPFARGIHRSPVNSPHKGQWRGALMFSWICALNKRLSKQSRGWWYETPSRSLWRHCNVVMYNRHFQDDSVVIDGNYFNTTFRYVFYHHYTDVIMGAIASQITSLTIVYSIVYSGADQRKHQSSASLAFVRGIHRGPVNSPHKCPVT